MNSISMTGHSLTLRAPRFREQPPTTHNLPVGAVLEGSDLGMCIIVTLTPDGDVAWFDRKTLSEHAAQQYIVAARALWYAFQVDQQDQNVIDSTAVEEHESFGPPPEVQAQGRRKARGQESS
jgi:hypothetical protein